MENQIKFLIWIFVLFQLNVGQVPNNVRVLSSEKDFLRIGWKKPDRFDSIYGYTVKYRAIHSNSSWIVRQTKQTEIVLNELRPITKYEIIVQAHTNSSYVDSAGPSTRIEATTDETGNFLIFSLSFSYLLLFLNSINIGHLPSFDSSAPLPSGRRNAENNSNIDVAKNLAG